MVVVSILMKRLCSVSSTFIFFKNHYLLYYLRLLFVLEDLQTELGQLSLSDGMTYQPLFEMTQVMILISYWEALHLFPNLFSLCIRILLI